MDPTESGVIESSAGSPDIIESNSGGPDIIGSGPDRTGSDHDGPDKCVIIPSYEIIFERRELRRFRRKNNKG
jgi:hypothetical protein